jgi:uncharacterized protein (UPF0262 family)
MIRLERVDQIICQPVVDHHRAEHRRFSLDILRQGGGCGKNRGRDNCCGHYHPIPELAASLKPLVPNRGVESVIHEAGDCAIRAPGTIVAVQLPLYGNRMADPRIIDVSLDERTILWRSADIEQERRIAIFDLIEGNYFKPERAYPDSYGGPFKIELAVEEGRLAIAINREDGSHLETFVLAMGRLRRPIRDYFAICDSYYQAIRNATPAQIETVDMARRGIHNEAAELLKERLEGKIEIDFDTARRLFTLICVLHIKG